MSLLTQVVPPTGWKATSNNYDNIDSIVIPGAIEQNAFGRGGFYECAHISNKAMTVGEFRKKTKAFEHITDNLNHEEVEELVLFDLFSSGKMSHLVLLSTLPTFSSL